MESSSSGLKFQFEFQQLLIPDLNLLLLAPAIHSGLLRWEPSTSVQVYYFIVDSPRNEGKEFFEINMKTGEIFTKTVFDREKQGAYALEVEARDGAPSARPNSNNQPNSGKSCDVHPGGVHECIVQLPSMGRPVSPRYLQVVDDAEERLFAG